MVSHYPSKGMTMTQSRFAALFTIILVLFITIPLSATAAEPAGSGDLVSGTGKVNAVMAAERKVNITHDPIPALDWPGMTMDFRLSDSASLDGIEAGSKVTFRLHKAADGAYEIESLSPSKE
jgi:Cu/Ag efflux protein CusF